ncbi:ABC transporter ATP-binding protein [Colwellia sp. E2M01]|uniref:ABC transporter ATP-binding protein n=1 Tax=Colwellia sp. E2M01 TaxID=2841561 RepID=UPI001C095716|nr:ABC transporter ATP-binding protein [Colwellia sp. E2M01]MBU2870162.1 ABC transporter ATP-binding protein [Colwellia sp. E2M01]
MITINNLSIKYDRTTVVDSLNLELASDEILMLVGPTGCGKSTILKALAGLIPIADGEICHQDWQATTTDFIAPEKRNVGMVFQDFALFPHLTVEQNIAFRLTDNSQADRWIELLGLQAFRHVKPNNLSGGQKQRVALARTLAHQPAFVLLDEPLSNLDAALKDDLRWEIRSALKTAGIPAIWVTHDQEEALSVGDRVGVLRAGKLEQIDQPERCYNEPVNHFVARFLGETNFIDAEITADKKCIIDALGYEQVFDEVSLLGKVDLLLRPEDFSVEINDGQDAEPSKKGEGKVFSMRYEGSSRLYQINVGDNLLKVRTRHDIKLAEGQSVYLKITTTKPITVLKEE